MQWTFVALGADGLRGIYQCGRTFKTLHVGAWSVRLFSLILEDFKNRRLVLLGILKEISLIIKTCFAAPV